MTLTKEDLQAISFIMDEKLEPVHGKLDSLEYRITSLEYSAKTGFVKINDEIETLAAVLEAKKILPKINAAN